MKLIYFETQKNTLKVEFVNLSNFGKSESAKDHKSQPLFGTIADKENTTKEAGIKNV